MLRASTGLLRLLMRFLDDEFLAMFDKMQSETINETRSAGIGKSAMSKRGMEGRMELPIVNRIKSKQFTHLFHSGFSFETYHCSNSMKSEKHPSITRIVQFIS